MSNFKHTHSNESFEICGPEFLYSLLTDKQSQIVVIDSRTFLEFNTCTVLGAVNVCCNKLVKRRLQAGKLSVLELLTASGQMNILQQQSVVLFDHCSETADTIFPDSFVAVLLKQLALTFCKVYLLRGGFLGFHSLYPHLCESNSNDGKILASEAPTNVCTTNLTNPGPTQILAHILVGSEVDAMDIVGLRKHGVTHVLNVSANCARAPRTIIPDDAFLRIAINDDYSEKILPHLPKAFAFLEKCRQSGGRCLVHCLAGISRSPTLAIAYVMHLLRLNSDEAYKFVKQRRVTISPNFNFLGQLMDLDRQFLLEQLQSAPTNQENSIDFHSSQGAKRLRMRDSLPLSKSTSSSTSTLVISSPTSALAQLSFGCSAVSASVLLGQITGTSLEKVEYTACHASADPVPVLAWPPTVPPLPFSVLRPPPRNVSSQQQIFTPFMRQQASSGTTGQAATPTTSRRRTHQQTTFFSNGRRVRPLSAALAQTHETDAKEDDCAADADDELASSVLLPVSKASSLEDLVDMKRRACCTARLCFAKMSSSSNSASSAAAAAVVQKSLCRLAGGSSGSISSSGRSSSQHSSLEILQCS